MAAAIPGTGGAIEAGFHGEGWQLTVGSWRSGVGDWRMQ
jgi:hypothetical protein